MSFLSQSVVKVIHGGGVLFFGTGFSPRDWSVDVPLVVEDTRLGGVLQTVQRDTHVRVYAYTRCVLTRCLCPT